MHQYQLGENGQLVKILELRIFLQTNIVRSSDTDKLHFSETHDMRHTHTLTCAKIQTKLDLLRFYLQTLFLKLTPTNSKRFYDTKLYSKSAQKVILYDSIYLGLFIVHIKG